MPAAGRLGRRADRAVRPVGTVALDPDNGLFGLNPMVGVVDGFRWALLGQTTKPDVAVFLSILITGILLLGGLYYFRRMERGFADVV